MPGVDAIYRVWHRRHIARVPGNPFAHRGASGDHRPMSFGCGTGRTAVTAHSESNGQERKNAGRHLCRGSGQDLR
ncbi:hypothetical protein SBRY_10482 [Actinacidiphila bryophytorum]|uniref:Uncharacterized protein n=1 Tax=Actinacidiphila bryophytorum TaxID=1436133 RepID=A0A9W4E0H8_9ACTN|nr:hypothetical protein SBRY_10482 [Actinacidiphila bryophytorum]